MTVVSSVGGVQFHGEVGVDGQQAIVGSSVPRVLVMDPIAQIIDLFPTDHLRLLAFLVDFGSGRRLGGVAYAGMLFF